MPRRSQRLQAGQSSTQADAASGLTGPRVERCEVNKENRKKRKLEHDAKNMRKKGGKLQLMLDMPLDIILEVSNSCRVFHTVYLCYCSLALK